MPSGGKRKNAGRKKMTSDKKKSQLIAFRCSIDEWVKIQNHSERLGYKSVSNYVRDTVNREIKIWGK